MNNLGFKVEHACSLQTILLQPRELCGKANYMWHFHDTHSGHLYLHGCHSMWGDIYFHIFPTVLNSMLCSSIQRVGRVESQGLLWNPVL